MFVAPASPPENLTVTALSSTSLSLSWLPPPSIDQNGIIQEYRVTITEFETGNVRELTSTATTLVVPSLHPYYNYECVVSAYTVGQGPFTENVTVQTFEDGTLTHLTQLFVTQQLLIMICLSIVPSGYPQNFTAEATLSQSAVIYWDPPLPDAQNGVIIDYVINVTELETGEMFQLFSPTTSLTVDSLSPYTTYICIIATTTSIGVGTFSTSFTIQTPEDGENVSHYIHGLVSKSYSF